MTKVLNTIHDAPALVSDPQRGEETVCAVCLAEKKPCKLIPDFKCRGRLKQGTELFELEERLDRIGQGSNIKCLNCGKPIDRKMLSAHPLSEVCSDCTD
jgi:hypothetical protein